MTIWTRTIDDENAAFNIAAMHQAGFTPDPGRVLTQEEIAALNLTAPGEIRDKRVKGKYYWNRGIL